MDDTDGKLLNLIQEDFPLVLNPYEVIGDGCGLDGSEVIRRLREHIAAGTLRNIAPHFAAHKLGYHSTLVAAKVPAPRIEEIAGAISAHPGVSHNYLRDHVFNIWFTLSVPEETGFDTEIRRIFESGDIPEYLLLPAVRTFKLRVVFDMGGNKGGDRKGLETRGTRVPPAPADLTETDISLLRRIQSGIPLCRRPWGEIGKLPGIDEEEVLARVRRLQDAGVIRRISGVLRHRRVGFNANGMACYAVPPGEMERAGRIAASFQAVSHCYERRTATGWNYPLFAMIHAKTRPECNETAAAIAQRIGCSDYTVLYSIREFKKEKTRYFKE